MEELADLSYLRYLEGHANCMKRFMAPIMPSIPTGGRSIRGGEGVVIRGH